MKIKKIKKLNTMKTKINIKTHNNVNEIVRLVSEVQSELGGFWPISEDIDKKLALKQELSQVSIVPFYKMCKIIENYDVWEPEKGRPLMLGKVYNFIQ